ncbi:hypothetical protein [Photobacterium leiognathi]|uniref:hypothetical protein n=1 Tax=Photobacterium leiognathi TaxID=553611 RepID=UPI002980AF63|nr:hypothetical protein [Photobacterium leiognathi]
MNKSNDKTSIYRHVTIALKVKSRLTSRPANYVIMSLIDVGTMLINTQATRRYLANFTVRDKAPISKKRRTGFQIASDLVDDLNHLGLKHGKDNWLTNVEFVRSTTATQFIYQPNSTAYTAIYPYFGVDDSAEYKMMNALSTGVTTPDKFIFDGFGDPSNTNQPLDLKVDVGDTQSKYLIASAVLSSVKKCSLAELNDVEVAVWVNGELVQSEIKEFKVIGDDLLALLNLESVIGFSF